MDNIKSNGTVFEQVSSDRERVGTSQWNWNKRAGSGFILLVLCWKVCAMETLFNTVQHFWILFEQLRRWIFPMIKSVFFRCLFIEKLRSKDKIVSPFDLQRIIYAAEFWTFNTPFDFSLFIIDILQCVLKHFASPKKEKLGYNNEKRTNEWIINTDKKMICCSI